MKKLALFLGCVLAGCFIVSAQDTYYSMFTYHGFIPQVGLNDRAAPLQASLYPEYYKTASVGADLKWVGEHDSLLVQFWRSKGDTVLHILHELSGLEWYETEFDIYLVRRYPTIGSSDPLILPLGGVGAEGLTEAMPEGSRQLLNLLYQLSRRMLAQADQPEDAVFLPMAAHPLMRPGPYRFDNLAMLLAISTAQSVLGLDSTDAAYRSAFWVNHFPGRRILDKYLLSEWTLTPSRTLVQMVTAEPNRSRLVTVTRPPRPPKKSDSSLKKKYIEGLPLKGRLGFSVRLGNNGGLVIDQIDQYRLAYACGLREGDLIYRCDGRRVRNQRTLVTQLLDGLDSLGVVVQFRRKGNTETVLVQNLMLPDYEDDFEEEDWLDSVLYENADPYYYDSLEAETDG